MTTTTMIKPATDDEIRQYLQAELRGALQVGGVEWLYQPIELAVEEALDQPEAPAADPAETMAGARHHLARLSIAAAEGDWREVADTLHWLEVALHWVLPGAPGSRARELQHELDGVYEAATAAMLQPGSLDWNTWRGTWYCQLLLDQLYYQPWLREALEAWERGADIAIEDDRYLTIIADDDLDED